MVPEAKLERTENGLAPRGEGWYVLNAREAEWLESPDFGRACTFEGDVRFKQLGINVGVAQPGQPACMYHRESAQEDFLVLAGECLLIVEGEERRLRAWDFFHCPPGTNHVLIGAGEGPCIVVAVGARGEGKEIVYPVDEVAQRHGAGVKRETGDPMEAYAGYENVPAPYKDDLPS